jgi:hypothetical protein
MTANTSGPANKVAAVLKRRDMAELGSELEQRWTKADSGDSVRSLAAYFNRRVIEDTLVKHGAVPTDRELEDLSEAFSQTGRDEPLPVEIKSRFADLDVTPEQVADNLVSHQTMYRYLTEVRDASPDTTVPSLDDRVSSTKTTVQKLQTRLGSVTQNNLDLLSKQDGFTLGEYEAVVSLSITCRECGVSKSLLELLDDRGCDCDSQ